MIKLGSVLPLVTFMSCTCRLYFLSKCNAKSCNCCQHLCTNTTITSSVNGRTFSVINNSDLD